MRCPKCRSNDTGSADFNGLDEWRCHRCGLYWLPSSNDWEFAGFFDEDDPDIEPTYDEFEDDGAWDY
jgi:hypothetical protein